MSGGNSSLPSRGGVMYWPDFSSNQGIQSTHQLPLWCVAPSNVAGLPVRLVRSIAREAGVDLGWSAGAGEG